MLLVETMRHLYYVGIDFWNVFSYVMLVEELLEGNVGGSVFVTAW